MLDKLSLDPINAKPDLLALIADQGFDKKLSPTDVLADPVDWTIAVTTHLELIRAYPEFMKFVKTSGTAQLIKIGEELRKAQQKIAVTSDTNDSKYDPTLLKTLVGYYRNQFKNLQSAVLAEKTHWESVNLKGYDLLPEGGKDSPYPLEHMEYCGTPTAPPIMGQSFTPAAEYTTLSLSPPDGLFDRIPIELQTASRMGLGKLKICYIAYVNNISETGIGGILTDSVIVRVYFNDLFVWSGDWDGAEVQVNGRSRAELAQLLTNAWEQSIKKSFFTKVDLKLEKQDFFYNRPKFDPDSSLPKLRDSLSAAKAQGIQAISAKAHNELATGNLHESYLELIRAKTLLQAFIAQGMPQSLENNDILRGLLLGKNAIYPSHDNLLSEFFDSTKPEEGLRNLLKTDGNSVSQRIDALEKTLDQIFSQGAANESHPLINSVLQQLNELEAKQTLSLPKASPDEALQSLRQAIANHR